MTNTLPPSTAAARSSEDLWPTYAAPEDLEAIERVPVGSRPLPGSTADGLTIAAGDKLRDGWLDAGDLGSVSADGFLTLTGRVKDVLIRGGHNIDPAAVEAVLREHPQVLDAGGVGRPDRHAGEVPVAFVVVTDAGVGADEIGQWAASRVSEPAAAPKAVTILPTLPYTAIGKPNKVHLRVLATQQELTTQLTGLGLPRPPGDTWCAEKDGRITVALPAPDLPGQRAVVTALLDSYALDWRLT